MPEWDPAGYAAAVGYIVMTAGDLEYCASGLVQFVLGDTDQVVRKHWGATSGVVLEGLDKAAVLRPEVGPIRDRFKDLTDHRNQLVHGLWSGSDESGQMEVLRPLRYTRASPVDLNVDTRWVDLTTLEAFRVDLDRLRTDVLILWATLRDPNSVWKTGGVTVWRM